MVMLQRARAETEQSRRKRELADEAWVAQAQRIDELKAEREEARGLDMIAMEWGTDHFDPGRDRYPWAFGDQLRRGRPARVTGWCKTRARRAR